MTHEKLLKEIINNFNNENDISKYITLIEEATPNGYNILVKLHDGNEYKSCPRITNVKILDDKNKKFIKAEAFQGIISMLARNFIILKTENFK